MKTLFGEDGVASSLHQVLITRRSKHQQLRDSLIIDPLFQVLALHPSIVHGSRNFITPSNMNYSSNSNMFDQRLLTPGSAPSDDADIMNLIST